MFPPPAVDGCVVPGRDDAVAPAPARLPPAGPVRPPQDAAGLQPARDARHGARGQGDRGLPRRRVRRLGRASHPRASSAGSRSPRHADARRSPPTWSACMFDGVDKLQHLCWRFIDPACRPARPTRVGARDDRALRARTSARSTRSSASSWPRRPGGDRRAGVRPRLRADARRVPRQLLARAGGLPGVGGCAERRGRRATTPGRVRGDHPPRPRARLGADARLRGDAEQSGHQHREPACRAATTPLPEDVRSSDRRRRWPRGCAGVRRPHDGRPLVAEVWTREEAFAGPYGAIGPDLSLVLADGGTISILPV